jgi:hypothetical protein
MLDTLNSLEVADLIRRPGTSRVLKIRSDQRYKQCLINVMIIELPRNTLNETLHPCRFGGNRLNMAQKGHSSVQNDPKILNLLDMFKFMTPPCSYPTQWVSYFYSKKSTRILQRSIRTFFQSTTLTSGPDHSETCTYLLMWHYNQYLVKACPRRSFHLEHSASNL